MRAFCGWIGSAGGAGAGALASRMLGTVGSADSVQVAAGSDWLLALAGGPGAGVLCESDHAATLLVGSVWTGDGAGNEGGEAVSRIEGALRAGDRGETGGGIDLPGQFALAAIDRRSAGALLAVDRFATHPLYVARIPDGIVFGSAPRIVAEHPQVDSAIHEQALFDFIYCSVVPAPLTVYRQVEAIRAGCGVSVAGGQMRAFRHWQPRFEETVSTGDDPRSRNEVLRLLGDAVGRWTHAGPEVGCFLSGGIDSSSIAGCVRTAGGGSPRTFSIGFDAEGYNELGFARTVARHFECDHREYFVTPDDILDLVPRISRAFGQPFGNSSVVPTFHCARLARESGVSIMLAGDGGDELFGGNERYSKDWVYSLYGRVPGAFRALGEHWARSERPLLGGLPLMRKAVSYVRHASIPLPARLDVYNYVNRLGIEAVLEPDFLATVDPGRVLEERRQTFRDARADHDLNRLLALEFEITLADNDLQKVGVMCREAGVEAAYPFLCDEVVDFSLGLAPEDKVRRGHLRWFFRKAVTGFLPDAVIRKSKHGFGLPFGLWAVEHPGLREWVGDTLGQARSRKIVNARLLEDLRGGRLAAQPRYYGPLVWVIAALETWLAANT